MATLTRRDEAHYVTYRRMCLAGFNHSEAYALATAILADLKAAGLGVTKRRCRDEPR